VVTQSTGWTVEYLDIGGSGHAGNNGRALFEVEDAENFTMQYNTIDGHNGSTAYKKRDRFVGIDQNRGTLLIDNNTFKNNFDDTDDTDGIFNDWTTDAHLLFLDYNENGATPTTSGTFTISNNTFEGAQADCIQFYMMESATGSTVGPGNTFTKWGENAIDQKSSSYITYTGNTFNRAWTVYKDVDDPEDGPDSNLSHIIIQDRSSSYNDSAQVTIKENYFVGQGDDRGINIQDSSDYVSAYNNYLKSVGSAIVVPSGTYIDIYNNVIVVDTNYTQYYGKGPGDYVIFKESVGPSTDTKFYNNSIYMGNTNHTHGIEWECISTQVGGEITNNVIHIEDADTTYGIFLEDAGSCTTEWPTLSNNAIYNSLNVNRTSMDSTVYDKTEQATYRSAWDANALLFNTGDTGLNNASGGELWAFSAESAIVDAGSATYAPANGLDYTSTFTPSILVIENVRGRALPDDIGAYEYTTRGTIQGITIQ
jgi:hypothetical protein